ncbi:nitrous oxide reductase accessory protein NosL [Chitinophaga filiformis]|nr:nitrous oxide reductase accessory protein NosL [Chitinophaga filiformis]
MNRLLFLAAVLSVLLLTSCKRSFQPIDYGKESCAHCRMAIMDKKFACEIVDKNGKAYKFDDLICMRKYASEHSLQENDLLLFVAAFNEPDKFIDAKTAILLKADAFRSPMSGGLIAVETAAAATHIQHTVEHAEKTTWFNLK